MNSPLSSTHFVRAQIRFLLTVSYAVGWSVFSALYFTLLIWCVTGCQCSAVSGRAVLSSSSAVSTLVSSDVHFCAVAEVSTAGRQPRISRRQTQRKPATRAGDCKVDSCDPAMLMGPLIPCGSIFIFGGMDGGMGSRRESGSSSITTA